MSVGVIDCPFVFVSIVNRQFVPGLCALMHSLIDNGKIAPGQRYVVLEQERTPDADRDTLRRSGFDVVFMPIAELGEIEVRPSQRGNRFEGTLDKLQVFRMESVRRICFLDADLLCLNPLHGIEKLEHFSVAPDVGIGLVPTWISGHPMFNTGFMVIEPSDSRFKDISSYYRDSEKEFELGDQGVLSNYFWSQCPEEVTLIDPEWNTLKRIKPHHPRHFDLQKIKFLHYVGDKPWDMSLQNRREWPYLSLNLLWHRSYRKARSKK